MQFTELINKASEKFFGKLLQQSDTAKITHGIKKTIIIQGLSYVLVFVSNILMVRVAGMENYGIYISVINWISLLSIIACQGMEDVVLADIPPTTGNGNFEAAKKIICFANKITLAGAVIVALLFLIVIISSIVAVFKNYQIAYIAALFNIYLFAFITVNQQSLQAFNRFYGSQLADKIVKPLLLVMIFATLYYFNVHTGPVTLINAVTVVQLICALVVLLFLKDTFKNSSNSISGIEEKKLTYGYRNFYFFFISLLYFLKTKIAIFIFGFAGNPEDTAVFNILCRLADFVLVPFFIIHSVAPQLFAKHKGADKSYKKELFNKITALTTLGALLVFVCVVLFGKYILGFYSKSLVESYWWLVILSAAQLFYSIFGPGSALLMMQGKQKQAAFILAADVIFTLLLFVISIKWYGLSGAVWATVLAAFIYNLLLRVMVNKLIS